MVVINEKDLWKTKLQVLMDLIYESTGQRIPEDKIKYGLPQKLDARPEVWNDPNTFVSVRIDPTYDDRYLPQTGFLYRRREVWRQFVGQTINVEFNRFPITLREILVEQINPQLRYPFDPLDIVDYKIDDPLTAELKFTAVAESFLWCDGGDLEIEPPDDRFFNLAPNPYLDGFRLYGAVTP
jgi:hypothetical protein